MDLGNTELFQTANTPTEHPLRTQLLSTLHFSHKKITDCISPILPYITLRLILHFSSLLCEDSELCRGVLPNCPSGVLLTEQTHWHPLYKSMQPRTYQCWHFLNCLLFRERQVSLHSFPLMFRYRFCCSLDANSVLTKYIFRHSLFHFSYRNTL